MKSKKVGLALIVGGISMAIAGFVLQKSSGTVGFALIGVGVLDILIGIVLNIVRIPSR